MATKASSSNNKVFQAVSSACKSLLTVNTIKTNLTLVPDTVLVRLLTFLLNVFLILQDDVHISFEDQQKINRFAKHNARMDDLRMELDMKKNDLKSVEEALDEIELFDEDEEIPFLFGEVFLTHKLTKTQV